jgi:hypothetical protein
MTQAHPLSAAVGKLRDALAPPTDGQPVARFAEIHAPAQSQTPARRRGDRGGAG